MYAGHFAFGMFLKAHNPRASTAGLLVGVGLLDLLFGPFVVAGLERVVLTPGDSPGFTLARIDWSHSLAMAFVWSGLYAILFLRAGVSTALVMGLAVFSHVLLDLPMHPPDIALWPGASMHLGFGLWQALPVGWWFVELAFVVGMLWVYRARGRTEDAFGHRSGWVIAVVILLHLANAPLRLPS